MPDLLILDMEIPKTCSQCPMCYDYMMCRPLNFPFAEMESFDCCDDRLGGCPLIQVPERTTGFSPYEVYTIVFCADGDCRHVTFAKYLKTPKRWELTGARSYWRVFRWMSLPEPPKEEDDNG